MPPPLDKVTAFITLQSSLGLQLLLLRHPYADFQFPAGTLYVFLVSLSAFGAQTN
jgi:hypothetical protein